MDEPSSESGQARRLAYDRAVRLLAQREHSLRELRDKLTRKGVSADLAGQVAEDLRGQGLQSDERFAEAFVHSRIGRGHGPVRIRQELAQRGIDHALADAALSEAADDWLAFAGDARARKFGAGPPADRDDWQRQARFLARRGFPSDVIYRVLGQGGE